MAPGKRHGVEDDVGIVPRRLARLLLRQAVAGNHPHAHARELPGDGLRGLRREGVVTPPHQQDGRLAVGEGLRQRLPAEGEHGLLGCKLGADRFAIGLLRPPRGKRPAATRRGPPGRSTPRTRRRSPGPARASSRRGTPSRRRKDWPGRSGRDTNRARLRVGHAADLGQEDPVHPALDQVQDGPVGDLHGIAEPGIGLQSRRTRPRRRGPSPSPAARRRSSRAGRANAWSGRGECRSGARAGALCLWRRRGQEDAVPLLDQVVAFGRLGLALPRALESAAPAAEGEPSPGHLEPVDGAAVLAAAAAGTAPARSVTGPARVSRSAAGGDAAPFRCGNG